MRSRMQAQTQAKVGRFVPYTANELAQKLGITVEAVLEHFKNRPIVIYERPQR